MKTQQQLELEFYPRPPPKVHLRRSCEWCGRPFSRPKVGAWERDAFCSDNCRQQHMR